MTRDDGSTDLLTVDLDGGLVTELTSTPDLSEREPAYSPDGTRIAYTRGYPSGDDRPSEIWTMGADGSDPARLLPPFAGLDDAWPNWSPTHHRAPGTFLTFPMVRRVTIDGDAVPVPGDFDGDGDTDILWYTRGPAEEVVWRANGDGTFTPAEAPAVGRAFRPFVGDFDGDGTDDVFWYGPGSDRDVLWRGQGFGGGGLEVEPLPTRIGWDFTPLAGDFDGDGDDDIAWYAPGPAPDRIWGSDGPVFGRFTPAPATMGGRFNAVAGDFDGDGDDDLFFDGPGSLPGTKTWEFTAGPGFPATIHRLDDISNTAFDHVLGGDFNADGHGDLYLHGDHRGQDLLGAGTSTTDFDEYPWFVDYQPFDRPFTGDFDGNGATDILWCQTGPGDDELRLFAAHDA